MILIMKIIMNKWNNEILLILIMIIIIMIMIK